MLIRLFRRFILFWRDAKSALVGGRDFRLYFYQTRASKTLLLTATNIDQNYF